MEAFESVVRLYFECKGYVVSGGIGISLKELNKKEREKAGIKVSEPTIRLDLVAARENELVICEVKSYFGSHGVRLRSVIMNGTTGRPIRLFSDKRFSKFVVKKIAEKYGYKEKQVKLVLAVGKFKGNGEDIRAHFDSRKNWQVISSREISEVLLKEISDTAYLDDPAIAALKCLGEAGHIQNTSDDVPT